MKQFKPLSQPNLVERSCYLISLFDLLERVSEDSVRRNKERKREIGKKRDYIEAYYNEALNNLQIPY